MELTVGPTIIDNGYMLPAICGTEGLAEGEEICVLYEIAGGSMTSVKANTEDVSLQFDIDATKDGQVVLRHDPQLRIGPSMPIILQVCAPKHATFV